jgi:hypothetical protein
VQKLASTMVSPIAMLSITRQVNQRSIGAQCSLASWQPHKRGDLRPAAGPRESASAELCDGVVSQHSEPREALAVPQGRGRPAAG